MTTLRTVDVILGDHDVTPNFLKEQTKEDLFILAKDLFELPDDEIVGKQANLAQHLTSILETTAKEMKTPNEGDLHTQNKKTVEDYVRDENNQRQAVDLAIQIRHAYDRKWFTSRDLHEAIKLRRNQKIVENRTLEADKLHDIIDLETIDELNNRLSVLSLFGLVKLKSDPKGKRPTKYKVVLTVIQKAIDRKKAADKAIEASENLVESAEEE
jgi:hypothetical protein